MKHCIAIAILSISATCNLMAGSIVGSWFSKTAEGYVVINFFADGRYSMTEDGRNNDPSGRDGMEFGTYKWNSKSKTFSSKTKRDTNGEWGLSHFPVISAKTTGSKLKLSSAKETFTLKRVAGGSKIVGGWYFDDDDGIGVITFLADGTYLMAEDGTSDDDPDGRDGMELGRYTWNASTGAISIKTKVDTTFKWGLSHAGVSKTSVSANKLSFIADDGEFVLKKIAAPKAAKKPEIAIQQPLGKDLTDGKSKKNFGKVKVRKRGKAVYFTIRNKGKATLTGLAIKKTGKAKRDFIVSKPGASKLAPGKKTTFKVIFKPTAAGARKAAIRISSNDADENPFDIKLTGSGVKKASLIGN